MQGKRGKDGQTGAYGAKGMTGDPGRPGQPGFDGVKGETGEVGFEGLTGPAGDPVRYNSHCYIVQCMFLINLCWTLGGKTIDLHMISSTSGHVAPATPYGYKA